MNMYLYVGSTCAHMKFRVEPQGLFFFFLTDPLTPEHNLLPFIGIRAVTVMSTDIL